MNCETPRNARALASAYDPFADIYNLHWRDSSRSWIGWCAVMLLPRLRTDATVLDLCCGAGHLTGALAEAGLQVIGLDGSRRMLHHARVNAPGVPLVEADARRFGMRASFDAVTCTFDSLNHLLTDEDLLSCFQSVSACLRQGGSFFFDVNTDAGYRLRWKGQQNLCLDDLPVSTEFSYDPALRLARFCARTDHRGEGEGVPGEIILWQRCHEASVVRAALKQAGLLLLEVFGLQGDAVVTGCSEECERLFYLCVRS